MINAKTFPSKYRNVQRETKNGKERWYINIVGVTKKRYLSEREAAIAIDMILIGRGKEPVNILKRKDV